MRWARGALAQPCCAPAHSPSLTRSSPRSCFCLSISISLARSSCFKRSTSASFRATSRSIFSVVSRITSRVISGRRRASSSAPSGAAGGARARASLRDSASRSLCRNDRVSASRRSMSSCRAARSRSASLRARSSRSSSSRSRAASAGFLRRDAVSSARRSWVRARWRRSRWKFLTRRSMSSCRYDVLRARSRWQALKRAARPHFTPPGAHRASGHAHASPSPTWLHQHPSFAPARANRMDSGPCQTPAAKHRGCCPPYAACEGRGA